MAATPSRAGLCRGPGWPARRRFLGDLELAEGITALTVDAAWCQQLLPHQQLSILHPCLPA
jgi:hypothetical protein